MIVYWAVPYLLAAAPPLIVLLSILIGGCNAGDPLERAQFYSVASGRDGEELVQKLDRRTAREDLRHIMDGEAQR